MAGKFVKAKGHALVAEEGGIFRTVDPGSVIECISEAEAADFVARGLGEPASGPASYKQAPRDSPARIEFGTLAAPEAAERADAPRQAAEVPHGEKADAPRQAVTPPGKK
jgi:hypothetical protein